MLVDEIMELASKEPLKLKLKDIVELTKSKPINMIAKEYLPIGEKIIRDILKGAGCVPNVGKKGWTYENGNLEVEKELGEFIKPTARRKNIVSASNKNSKSNSIKNSKNVNNDTIVSDNKNDSKKDDNMVSEIKALIKGTSKNNNARIYKGIYFDKDIAKFLDNIQHGNKSEIVNKIMRQYLMDNELM